MIEWIDAHTHLDSDSLFPQRDEVIQRALQSGVQTLLLVNSECTQESFDRTQSCLQESTPVRKYAAFGVHPHQASLYADGWEAELRTRLVLPGVIALGEIGLDYYYDYSPRDVQRTVLKKQLALSSELQLPVVIHCRDAYVELAEILRAESGSWRGMIHCFTGTVAEAEPLVDLGFVISYSGIVTFRNADSLREAALRTPANRILVETDAPFLTPVPHRGKTNEPAFVADTGQFVANLRGESAETFAEQTRQNFAALFGVPESANEIQ